MNQILAAIILAFLPSIATAAVIETNEWNNLTRPGWEPAYGPSIDAAPAGGSSPGSTGVAGSGGSALRANFPVGHIGGTGGGTETYTFPSGYSDIYVGHWLKFSSPFLWNAIAQKVNYMYTDTTGTTCSTSWRIANTNTALSSDATCDPLEQQRYNNYSYTPFQLNRWYWWEQRMRLSNPLGAANGVQEIWVDDKLIFSHSDRILNKTSPNIGRFVHGPTRGGGGETLTTAQYIWFDHTVISTTRIGRPGGGTDTSPPMPPTSLQVR